MNDKAPHRARFSTSATNNLILTPQERLKPDIEVGPDACTSPRDIQRAAWDPSTTALPDALLDALEDLVGGLDRARREDALVDAGVTALRTEIPGGTDGHEYARLAAYATDSSMERWRLLQATRQLGGSTTIGQHSTLDDVEDGPIAALAAASTPAPKISIDLSGLFELKSGQREAVLRHLLRLAPGVRVRLIASRIDQRKLLASHEDILPASVTERAKSGLQLGRARSHGRARGEQLRQQARALLEGDLDPDHIDWRRLQRVLDAPGGRMSYDALEADTLCSFGSRDAVKQFAHRSADRGLVDRDGPRHDRHVRLTALAVAALSEHPDLGPDPAEDPFSRGCGPTDATEQPRADAQPGSTVSDPPKTLDSTVYSQPAHEGPHRPDVAGEGQDRSTAEGRPDAEAVRAVQGGADDATNRNVDAEFFDRATHHGTAAVATDGEIGLVDRQIDTSGDSRVPGWSFDPERDEVVVDVEASGKMCLTMTRLCAALLSEPAFHQVLTEDRIAGGPDRSGFGGLPVETPYVLRSGATMGWMPDYVETRGGKRPITASDYREFLRAARNELLARTEHVQDDDGGLDEGVASRLLKDAHGLAGTVTRLYDMLGVDLVRRIRAPPSTTEDDARRGHYAKMIAKQTSISSRYGVYTAERVLHEPRPEKREQLLGTPNVDASDPVGDVMGSWAIVGPDASSLEPYLRHPDEHLELQEDGEHFAPFLLEYDVVDGNGRTAFATAAARLCSFKNIKSTRSAVSLLRALAGDPISAATALEQLHEEDSVREIDVFEVRYGFRKALLRGAFDAERVVPDLAGDVVSRVVATLLEAREPLSKREVADRADTSTQAMGYQANQDAFDALEAVGLLDREDQGPGKAVKWRIRLPQRVERRESSAASPGVWGGETGLQGVEIRLTDAIWSSIARLADEIGTDIDVDLAGDAAMRAFGGSPDRRDVGPLLRELPALRPIVELVASLLDRQVQDVVDVDVDHDPPSGPTVQLGLDPSPATEQASLEAAATAGD